MERLAVESSNIREVGYDAETATLEVEFTNGSVYSYNGVPESEFRDLLNAESKGRFFNTRIKGSFSYAVISGPTADPAGERPHFEIGDEFMDRRQMVQFATDQRRFADSSRSAGGSTIIVTRDHGTAAEKSFETRAIRNTEKEGLKRQYFSFAPDDDISVGDVIRFKASRDLWLVTGAEDQLVADLIIQRKVFFERFTPRT